MFLSPEEVAAMTGYQKPSHQTKWLTAEKFGFVIGGDGHPKVLRDVVLSRLGAVKSSRKEPQLRLTG